MQELKCPFSTGPVSVARSQRTSATNCRFAAEFGARDTDFIWLPPPGPPQRAYFAKKIITSRTAYSSERHHGERDERVWEPPLSKIGWAVKVKRWSIVFAIAFLTLSQTREQKHFTVLEVAADWHELMIPRRILHCQR